LQGRHFAGPGVHLSGFGHGSAGWKGGLSPESRWGYFSRNSRMNSTVA